MAIDVDGAAHAAAVPYRLSTPTRIEAELTGATGAGAGTAVKLHADGVATARVMGVEARVRVSGFAQGYWLRQASTDLSKFVNGNRLDGFFAATLQSLVMESAHVNGYGLDGNQFWIQHQPLPGTTVPAMILRGQSNHYDLRPYDWDAVANGAPYAVVVSLGVRTSDITVWQDPIYVEWQTVDRNNQFSAASPTGGRYLDLVKASASDGIIRVQGASIRLDNAKCIAMRNAANSVEQCVLMSDASSTTAIRSLAGGDLVLDANKVGGVIAARIQGSNTYYMTNTHLAPAVSETQTLGTSTIRWGTAYVTSIAHKVYTVATLPSAGGRSGWTAFVSDGRKQGEGAGSGTGVMVYSDGTAWRRVSDDTAVSS